MPDASPLSQLERLAPKFGRAHSVLDDLRTMRNGLIQEALRAGHTEREVASVARVSRSHVHALAEVAQGRT